MAKTNPTFNSSEHWNTKNRSTTHFEIIMKSKLCMSPLSLKLMLTAYLYTRKNTDLKWKIVTLGTLTQIPQFTFIKAIGRI